MKYYERLQYKLSRGFKQTPARELLEHHLSQGPNSIFNIIPFRDRSYELFIQGDRIKYEIDENTGNITVYVETIHEYKKRYIVFQVRKSGNEVNIVTKTPKEDTSLVHIRHNTNSTVSSLSRRIKFYDREDEQILETRYALFSENGDMLDYNEQISDESGQKSM